MAQAQHPYGTFMRTAAIGCALALGGCATFGGERLQHDQLAYARSIDRSEKQQTLMNIVSLRYADTPTFLPVTQVIAGYGLDRTANASFGTVFGAGVPVLVVPESAKLTTLGERILVAWNHSREAMLAIRGALPLLARAAQVVVLDGAAQDDELGARHLPRLDLAAWLQRHGVSTQIRRFAPKNDYGANILAEARSMQADTIVMGAWGHSRIAQLVLGGTTRYLFQNSDVPLLVAH